MRRWKKCSTRMLLQVDETELDDEVAAGPSASSSRGTPVVLTPGRPDPDGPSPAKLMPARPKLKPKASAELVVGRAENAEETKDVKEEIEETSTTTKMTSEVKQVPKKPEAKARPQDTPPATADQPTSKPASETTATYVAPASEASSSIPIGQSENASDNLWAHDRGSGRDVRDPQHDPQYVEVAGSVVRIPTPPQPSRREGEGTINQEEDTAPGKGKGHGQSKGKWKPVLNPQGVPEGPGRSGNRSRFLNPPAEQSTTYSKGKEKGSSKGKGKKGKGGKNRQVWTYTEEYIPTNLWGNAEHVRRVLQ